jgi:hypothetical protein
LEDRDDAALTRTADRLHHEADSRLATRQRLRRELELQELRRLQFVPRVAGVSTARRLCSCMARVSLGLTIRAGSLIRMSPPLVASAGRCTSGSERYRGSGPSGRNS